MEERMRTDIRWHGILDVGGVASFATLTVGVGLD
jgi:hypothetical protein